MLARVGGSALLVLLVAAGVAVAASRVGADATGLAVCVNDANGLVRVADRCREHETGMALGGINLQVTSGDTTLAAGGEAVTATLPVTGTRLTATCIPAPPQVGDILNARMRLTARAGETFDLFLQGGGLSPSQTLGVAETLLAPAAGASSPGQLETVNGQTALIKTPAGSVLLTIGGNASVLTDACRFSWLAQEVPA